MDASWTPDKVVESVRRLLASAFFDHRHLIDRVDLVDEDVLVVLRGLLDDDELYGVRFSLAQVPRGPSTGEACDSAEQWAGEVAIDLDEAIGTREIERAEQKAGQDGVVLLRWWPGANWSR
jgi:hypothetical protein